MKFAIAATYTAEPLLDSLSFWNQKLGWQADIEFAPYNQVFQQLLDPASLVATNRKGANILLVRPEDWVRYGADQNNSEAVAESATKIQQTAQQLVDCVRSAAQRSHVPYFVCLCPSSPDGVVTGYLAAEKHIYAELQNVAGVQVFSSTALLASYSVGKYYDAERDAVGHIPYTAEFFAALGTVICRRLYSLQQPPAKVIALDCDETLWAGVCGEVGPRGINLDSGRQYLQRFMVGQAATGTLLCLCSKNNPEDVDEVFQCHTEMPLKHTHIAASRVNWQSKPANLRELASELQLGLDSFIFLDDSPVECEQMKLSCPEVVTLQLPADNEKIQSFLDNVWAFDKHKVTEEDRQRTVLYQQNRDRDLFRQAAPTLESFLAGLQLQCTIAPLTLEQLARVSQLTVRTNQFNCTTVRRSEDQILQPWKAGELECLTVSVSDRFGHYGLVGAMMFCSTPEALKVDSFLLSCRVLGRGVEHSMLRNLGEVAFARGIPRINIRFVPSKKNSPALSFLESVAGQFKHAEEAGYWFRVPAEYAAKLSDREVFSTLQVAVDAVQQQQEKVAHASAAVAPSDLIQEIATKLTDAKTILAAIEQGKGLPGLPQPDPGGQPGHVREAIVDTWRRVLDASDVGPDDDFFSLGGDSLPAIQVLMRLNQVFGVSLELQDIFDHPTVSGLASVIEGALRDKGCSESTRKPGPLGGSPELQAAAVAAAKTDKSADDCVSASVLARNTPASQAIEQRTQKGPCALSFAQESWWFLNQWAPTSPDLSSCVLRLRGALNVAALQHALSQFVKRHEALRTVFQATEHGPVQLVRDPMCVELPIIDLGDAQPGTETRAEQIVEDEASKPFDLASDLMLRPTLLRLAADDHVLILIAHHIAFDAASRETLLHELEILYSAFVQGQPDPLPGLTTQYADYAVWQRNLISNGGLQGQLHYWKQRLAGIPARIELPRDRNTTSTQLCRGAQKSAILPNELATALRSLAQREGVTMFMLLLAAFQTLLHRYSAQDDVVVGSPDSGRSHPQTEGVVGCFVNVLLFRTDFSGNPTFRELLARVRELVLQVRSNQDVPLPKLVQELEPGRNMNQSPLFQVIFAFEKALTAPQLPGLEVSVRELDTRTALHDVSLFAAEVPQGLRLKFECKKEVFEPATIERMLAHMSTLLHEIVADPDRHVSTLPILTRNEEEQLTRGWNSFQNYPVKNCIHELFETQVQRAPQQVALVFEQQEITYAELNARANQVAHYLERMGIGPEVLVGLCVERSIDMVVAILGILKAGGAYLPLDPSYPKDRLQFMLSDAKPPVVVTQYELKELFPEFDGQIIALDADWPEIGQESTANMECPARPGNLAYVIYTSGSTGRPKGCQITHHNVVRLFEATWTWYQFDASDVWTMFHSYAFDFSVWELWGALIYGGRLVVVPYLVSRSPEDFYQLVEREKVTVLNQTPSSFKQLMNADALLGGGNRLSLRYVIFGGEALEMQSLRPWFQRHGDQKPRLVNMYGITETTVHVTYRPLSLADTEGGSVIGRPLPDLQLYLLDRYRQPVPVGVPGELYVGGAGVARGYLNRPELTAERFIRDPFRPDAQARLYKTGDSARRLGNGDVEYLGRIDQQVKIRGFRIELGEVEAVLARHRDVRESLVVVSENESGDKRLVAYVVPRDGAVPTSGDLYVFLREHLPEYMVPSAFVMLHHIPLTSNGKVDRRALPEPTTSRPEQEIGFVAPRTPLEEEVALAWTQVLELEKVGIHDNFFEIGGHSLLATRVITRLRANLGVNLSLRLLFENPTVAGMALVVMEILLDHCDQLEIEELINRVEGLSDETAQQLRSNMAATEVPVDQPL